MTKPPIERVVIPAAHYGKGRKYPISQISEHHVVGDASHVIEKAKTQEFSATFTVGVGGTIYQLVDLEDTPYTDNDHRSNGRSITIEHAGGHPNFPYTEAMYRSSIALHAWLFSIYGELHCVRHRDIPEIKADSKKATACPGTLDVERIVREAKKLLKENAMDEGRTAKEWHEQSDRFEEQSRRHLEIAENRLKEINELKEKLAQADPDGQKWRDLMKGKQLEKELNS